MNDIARSRVWLLACLLTFVLAACQSSNDGEDILATGNLASVGNLVWDDYHPNGILEEGEPGLEGVKVWLVDPGDDAQCDTSDDKVLRRTLTNESGRYGFDGIDPGSYCIRFILLDDFVFSAPNQGSDDSIDSDAKNRGYTDIFTLVAGENDFSIDAAMHPPKTCIGDFVFNDLDQDGIQDPDEPGIEGVEVQLVDPGPDGLCGTSDDSVLETTSTDANGFYAFNGLSKGEYCVQFVRPDGFIGSPQEQGDDEAVDSNPDPDTGITEVISVVTGETEITIDAGFYKKEPATLGDFVFNDRNANGLQEFGEPGIGGLPVVLIDPGSDGDCEDSDTVLRRTRTNSNGRYLFTGLEPGDYCVMFSAPDGFVFSPPDQGNTDTRDSDADPDDGKSPVVSLGSGELNLTVDAGVYEPDGTASLGDRVFNDLDQDGIQDDGEPGLSGLDVMLIDPGDDGDCEDSDEVLDSTTTNGNGSYLFSGLEPGDYCVMFDLPDGFVFSPPNEGDDDEDSDADPSNGKSPVVNLSPGEFDDSVDAGGYEPDEGTASLGDRVFNDLNQNGLQDPNEPGIDGLEVMLIDPGDDGDCEDGDEVLDTAITNSSGIYNFTNLAPGDYCVMFNLPDNFVFSPQDQGNDDSDDSDANPDNGKSQVVTLEPGDVNNTVDAGGYEPQPDELGSIGDRVFEDLNGNGIQNAGEPGVPGVTVQLKDCDGNVLDTDTTDSSGNYLFDELEEDCYIVDVLPNGFSFSPQDQGDDDSRDSDVDPETGETGEINLDEGEDDLSNDAGVYDPASLGDRVFNDLDQDGIQDAGEPGLSGLEVMLLDPGDDGVCEDGDEELGTDTTDGSGNYSFGDLVPGDYCVMFNLPDGFVYSPQNQGNDDSDDSDANPADGKSQVVTLESGDNDNTVDAGGYEPQPDLGRIGDTVFRDEDGDRIQDADEPGIPGVTVRLRDPGPDGTCGTGDDATLESQTTDSNGNYLFDDLPEDSYCVDVDEGTVPEGLSLTTNNDPLNVNLGEGQSFLGADFGYAPAGITIEKTPDSQTVVSGDDVTFTITITNTGSVTLRNVVVDDPLAPDCNRTFDAIGSGSIDRVGTALDNVLELALAPGDSETYTCTRENVTESFTNVATVTGETPGGDTVTDEDDAEVNVSAPVCAIDLEVTADPLEIIPGPTPGCGKNNKDNKPRNLTFVYTGGSCAASNNNQDDKFDCEGSATSQTVTIVPDDDDVFASPATVSLGQEFTLSTDDDKFSSGTELQVGGQFLDIHTSCSAPIQVGDVYGALTLVGFNGQRATDDDVTFTYEVTNNGADLSDASIEDSFGTLEDNFSLASGESITFTRDQGISSTTTNNVLVSGLLPGGAVCEAEDSATVEVLPPPLTCEDGKPTALVFEYTGESCAASNNTQDDKFECSGTPSSGTVTISLTKDADEFIVDPSTVNVGDRVRISTRKGPDDNLKSNTQLNVGGQRLEIHTSCSAPLNVGDQFGSLILREFIPEND